MYVYSQQVVQLTKIDHMSFSSTIYLAEKNMILKKKGNEN